MCTSICIVLIIVILFASISCNEAFNGGPSNADKQRIVNTALNNQHLFDKKRGSFNEAKSYISGLDNITYEDFRTLHYNGNFNRDSLMNAISV